MKEKASTTRADVAKAGKMWSNGWVQNVTASPEPNA
jgi:hypothetical protein